MRTAFLTALILHILLVTPAMCAEQFKDVPKDHWAAEFVQVVKADGVMKGYPDATFKGDKPVTRYELAVALERMIAFIEQSLKPEIRVESGKSKVESQGTPSPSPQPSQPGEGVERGKSKVESQDPAQFLKSGGYIAASSPLLANRNKTVSSNELAQALASVASRLIEKHIAPPTEE